MQRRLSFDSRHFLSQSPFCPFKVFLCCLLFGDSFYNNLLSRPRGVAWVLGLHGFPSYPHSEEGVTEDHLIRPTS